MKIHFSSNNSLISRAICWWTSAPVSHVAIEIDGYVYEALAQGFIRRGKTQWMLDNRADPSKHIETFDLYVPHPDKARAWLDNRIGDKYDYPGFIAYLIPSIKELPANLYCSEAARLALIQSGIQVPYEQMHPGALRWFLIGQSAAK